MVRSSRLGSAALLLLLLAGCTDSGSAPPARKASTAQPAPTETPVPVGSWRTMAPAPIPPAAGMATAWTGRQLVVWGGAGAGDEADAGTWHPASAGAAYDPAADRWDRLPPAPVAARVGATAVWTGHEVLFWGGAAGHDEFFADGAAYDPATRRWRVLPTAPIGARSDHEAVWTGKEMVVWGGVLECCPTDSEIHDPAAAAYDPQTNRWRRLPDVPFPWSGDDGTAVTLTDGDRPLIWRRGHLGTLDRRPESGGVWAEVPGVQPPALPADPATPSTTGDPLSLGAVAGGEVFTWTGRSGRMQGLAWRPSDGTWRRTTPLEAQSGGAVVSGGPDRLFAAAGQSPQLLEYSVSADRWSELPMPPIRTRSAAVLVWTGSELIFWGGAGDEGPEMDGAIWHCC